MGKVIPVVPVDSGEAARGSATRLDLPLTRREFLKGSGILIGTIAAGSALSALAPSRVWAVELKTLSQGEGTALMKMARVLYPHKRLDDSVYALVAKDLDADASADPKKAQLLKDGVAALDKQAGGSFAKAGAARQLAAVKSMQGQPFFEAVRGKCITSLYNNDLAFASFGYEGASWDKGGYIRRGFQDIKWLPNPPADISPKPFA